MTEKDMLMRRIAAYSFTMWELGIYLDTHPMDEKALKTRADVRQKRMVLVQEYEMKYGPYVVTSEDVNAAARWTWIDNPWPWDYVKEG